jgi:hypothetical protein
MNQVLSVWTACFLGPMVFGGCSSYRSEPAYEQAKQNIAEGMESGQCKKTHTCGDLAFINCGIEVDGAGYYIDSASGDVLEICGGACMIPSETRCVACPPPEWTCGN